MSHRLGIFGVSPEEMKFREECSDALREEIKRLINKGQKEGGIKNIFEATAAVIMALEHMIGEGISTFIENADPRTEYDPKDLWLEMSQLIQKHFNEGNKNICKNN